MNRMFLIFKVALLLFIVGFLGVITLGNYIFGPVELTTIDAETTTVGSNVEEYSPVVVELNILLRDHVENIALFRDRYHEIISSGIVTQIEEVDSLRQGTPYYVILRPKDWLIRNHTVVQCQFNNQEEVSKFRVGDEITFGATVGIMQNDTSLNDVYLAPCYLID